MHHAELSTKRRIPNSGTKTKLNVNHGNVSRLFNKQLATERQLD